MQAKKETLKLRDFEERLLSNYKHYLEFLESICKGNAIIIFHLPIVKDMPPPGVALVDVATTQFHFFFSGTLTKTQNKKQRMKNNFNIPKDAIKVNNTYCTLAKYR